MRCRKGGRCGSGCSSTIASATMELMLSGRTGEARAAQRMGLIDYAVPLRQLRRADQRRQPHGAAEAGMNAELHLGQAETGTRLVLGGAVTAGEREFEAAGEAEAVNHRHGRDRQLLQALAQRLA